MVDIMDSGEKVQGPHGEQRGLWDKKSQDRLQTPKMLLHQRQEPAGTVRPCQPHQAPRGSVSLFSGRGELQRAGQMLLETLHSPQVGA